jgi:Zn-finger nucleic acid-binding protein
MICPLCKVPMLVLEFEGIELDCCNDCAGVWFDRGELLLLFGGSDTERLELRPEHIDGLPEAPSSEKKRKCPLCRQKMRKVYIGPRQSVLIDVCPEGDGLWFDGGEVEALGRQYEEAQQPVPRIVLRFIKRVFCPDETSGNEEEDKA